MFNKTNWIFLEIFKSIIDRCDTHFPTSMVRLHPTYLSGTSKQTCHPPLRPLSIMVFIIREVI